jgi:hypothetical protein
MQSVVVVSRRIHRNSGKFETMGLKNLMLGSRLSLGEMKHNTYIRLRNSRCKIVAKLAIFCVKQSKW